MSNPAALWIAFSSTANQIRRFLLCDRSTLFKTGICAAFSYLCLPVFPKMRRWLLYFTAQEAPELVTAATIVGGNLPKNSECADQYRRLEARPVMFVNGTSDNIVPYQGGEVKVLMLFSFGHVFSTDETVEHWVQAADLDSPPRVQHFDTEDDGTSIDLFRWSEPGKPEIRSYRVNGGKHTLPMPATGGKCDDLISTSHDMNTIEEAWKFFKASELPSNSTRSSR